MKMIELDLRAARERSGLSQQELADAVGVRQATISALERGASRRIDFDLLERLALALGVLHPGELLRWEPERSTP
jgi:transcriptional regulator with XRE-family HTH domain